MALDLEQTSAVNVCQEDYTLENSLHCTITKNLEMESCSNTTKQPSESKINFRSIPVVELF